MTRQFANAVGIFWSSVLDILRRDTKELNVVIELRRKILGKSLFNY